MTQEQILDYFRSAEYAKEQKPFNVMCEDLLSLKEKYSFGSDESLRHVEMNTAYKEYACGGEVLYLGYYHPSPIFDVVIDKAKLTFQYHLDMQRFY